MNNRLLELDGASNFRDLGGYETGDGMRLKKGLIFRSCLLYTSPSPRDRQKSRMPSSA